MVTFLNSNVEGSVRAGISVGGAIGLVRRPQSNNAKRLELARRAMIVANGSFKQTTEYQLLTKYEKRSAVAGALARNYEQSITDTGCKGIFKRVIVSKLVYIRAVYRYYRDTLSLEDQKAILDQYITRFNIYLNHEKRMQLSLSLPAERVDTDIEEVLAARKPFELIEQYISYAHLNYGLTFRDYALLEANHGKDFSDALLATKNASLIGKVFETNVHTQPISSLEAMQTAYKSAEEAEASIGLFSRAFGCLKSMVVGGEEPARQALTKEEVTTLLKLHRAAEHTPVKLSEKISNAFIAAIKETIEHEGINQPSLDQIVSLLRNNNLIQNTFESYPLLNIFVRGYIQIGYWVVVDNIEFYLNLAGAEKTNKEVPPSHTTKELQDIFVSQQFKNKVCAYLKKEIDKEFVLDVVDNIVESTETFSGPLYEDEDYNSLLSVVLKGPIALGYEAVVRAGQAGLKAGLQAMVEAEYS